MNTVGGREIITDGRRGYVSTRSDRRDQGIVPRFEREEYGTIGGPGGRRIENHFRTMADGMMD